MKLFKHQEIFFIENYKIFSEKDYKINSNYPSIIRAMNSYKPDANSQRICFSAIDSHTWVLKEPPKTGIYIFGKDRRYLTIANESVDPLPIIRQQKLDKDRPHLFVRPWIQKKSGQYINHIISDDNDTVNIKLVFQVENIGDKAAINISAGDDDPCEKSLRPGEKIYYNKEIALIRQTVDKHSPQELISQEYVLTFGTTISYSNELGNKKYLTEFLYHIGKSNVQLVKYSLQ